MPTVAPETSQKLQAKITNRSTLEGKYVPLTVKVVFFVWEGSWWFSPGNQLHTLTNEAVLLGANTATIVKSPSFVTILTSNSRRDVGVEVYYNGVKVKDWQGDDIFHVEEGAGVEAAFIIDEVKLV